ncbi:hypothetical protein WN51_05846 [Melipona quadrifasciata]|uniref:Uncharacterized protein n=1 Tax=Melipona quadrifasciata TaxID=166423 RepID=A0A0N0U6I0_9HYME|nr:hypothetical protein WN51_05846 [Melipona quadrifasciata]
MPKVIGRLRVQKDETENSPTSGIRVGVQGWRAAAVYIRMYLDGEQLNLKDEGKSVKEISTIKTDKTNKNRSISVASVDAETAVGSKKKRVLRLLNISIAQRQGEDDNILREITENNPRQPLDRYEFAREFAAANHLINVDQIYLHLPRPSFAFPGRMVMDRGEDGQSGRREEGTAALRIRTIRSIRDISYWNKGAEYNFPGSVVWRVVLPGSSAIVSGSSCINL